MEVENSEPRPAGEGDVTRTATLRRWSTRLRPKLRELALAVAEQQKTRGFRAAVDSIEVANAAAARRHHHLTVDNFHAVQQARGAAA